MTYALTKGTYDDVALVKGLKNDVPALIYRCNMLEKAIKDLQSICKTHERSLETFRQYTVNRHGHQGTLDLSYQGEEFESHFVEFSQ